jgi:hypothetical protein
MNQLPLYIPVIFILTTALSVFIFSKAHLGERKYLWFLVGWLFLQAILAFRGFYLPVPEGVPVFFFLIIPPLFVIAIFFLTNTGRSYIDQLDMKMLTLIHIIRVPVELVLYGLFLTNLVPKAMTFEGRNLDILAGLSAPLVLYWGFVKSKITYRFILIWNVICLGLLVNIVIIAILSLPLPFRQFGQDLPEMALLYFPFVWLPCCIVPIILFSHIVVIRQLLVKFPGGTLFGRHKEHSI